MKPRQYRQAMIDHAADLSNIVPSVLEAAGLPTGGDMEREDGGIANHVYRVGDDYIVRIGSGSDGKEFGKTCAVLRAIDGQVKAQRLLYADDSCRVFDFPVMVCEYVPGETLEAIWRNISNTQKRNCFHQLLEELDRLHEIDWRRIDVFDNTRDWVVQREEALQVVLKKARDDASVDQGLVDDLEAYWAENHHMLRTSYTPVLIHNDANVSNVIFSRDLRLNAVIDFDDCDVAPAEAEYWNITFELLGGENPPSINEIKGWLRGYYEFEDLGALVRLKLDQVYWYLFSMVEDLSWRSKPTSRAEAHTDYQEIFLENSLRDWFPSA